MEDLLILIGTYPQRIRTVLLKYNILKEPSVLSVASAYALYGESFKVDLYNEIFGDVNYYDKEPSNPALEPLQEKKERKKINWQKFGENLNKSLDFLSKAVPVAAGVYNITTGNIEPTKVGYTDENGFTIQNRDIQQKENQKMFLIVGAVVFLLVLFLFFRK